MIGCHRRRITGAWGLQQAIDLQASKRETFGILSLLTDERIRVTANMAETLMVEQPSDQVSALLTRICRC